MEEFGRLAGRDEFQRESLPPLAIPLWELPPLGEAEERPTIRPTGDEVVTAQPRANWQLPVFLFVATWVSTFWVAWIDTFRWDHAAIYSLCLMTILVSHEAGHFLQARRYRVRASLPYFIPFPLGPIGTLGAVIGMSSHVHHRRALFDIGISGPLAGLIPTLIFCIAGLQWSYVDKIIPGYPRFGEPILLKWLFRWQFGEIPPGYDVYLHPMAWAGWVGLFITSLNLIPIGQLDGGHILYALMGRDARRIASGLLLAAVALVVVTAYWWWLPMLLLLFLLGPKHPPTADDRIPLDTGRRVLGWLMLAFVVVGFTPRPVILEDRPLRERPIRRPEHPLPLPSPPEWEPESEYEPILVDNRGTLIDESQPHPVRDTWSWLSEEVSFHGKRDFSGFGRTAPS